MAREASLLESEAGRDTEPRYPRGVDLRYAV